MKRLLRTVLVAVATLGLAGAAVVAAPAALAHDALASSDPADGATVATVPDAVALTFDEPALAIGTSVKVTGPAGQEVGTGAARLVDDTVTQDLLPGAPAGAYRIAWRVTSADGHPVSGELTFTATAANARGAAGGATSSAVSTATPGGSSTTASSAPGASGPTAGTTATSGPGAGVVVGLVVAVLVLLGLVAALLTRRRRSHPQG